jgi:hypothetical protein
VLTQRLNDLKFWIVLRVLGVAVMGHMKRAKYQPGKISTAPPSQPAVGEDPPTHTPMLLHDRNVITTACARNARLSTIQLQAIIMMLPVSTNTQTSNARRHTLGA